QCRGARKGEAQAGEGQEEAEEVKEEAQGQSGQGRVAPPCTWGKEGAMKRRACAHSRFPGALALLCAAALCCCPAASAAPAGPGWTIRSVAQPTSFSTASNASCEQLGGTACDSYTLIVTNVGGGPTPAGVPVTISDTLPAGVHPVSITGQDVTTEAGLSCSTIPLQCGGGNIGAGGTLTVTIDVTIEKQVVEPNVASVSGGGAPAATTAEEAASGSEAASFGIQGFSLQAFGSDGSLSTQAGGHPYTVASTLDFTSEEIGRAHRPPEEVKDII